MKSLGGGNKAIDTIKSPHKRETFYEIRNIAHKKENKENIKERLFSQPLFILWSVSDYRFDHNNFGVIMYFAVYQYYMRCVVSFYST